MSEKKNVLDIYDDILSGRVKLAQKTEETKTGTAAELLCGYLAMQRTMVIVFQHAHWKCKANQNNKFYGQHMLFERIYDAANELIDATAEKIIGIFGNDSLDHINQLEIMAGIYKKYNEEHLTNSINISKDFLKMAEDVYNRIKEMGDMTLGLDDMIMSQCSDVEGYLYLLQQASPEIKSEIESEPND